jgi:hypothetical protein
LSEVFVKTNVVASFEIYKAGTVPI